MAKRAEIHSLHGLSISSREVGRHRCTKTALRPDKLRNCWKTEEESQAKDWPETVLAAEEHEDGAGEEGPLAGRRSKLLRFPQ